MGKMNMIKIAFVVCCAAFAAAEAEADAALLYGGYGYGAGLGYAGLGYGAGLGYAGLGYGYGLAAPVATGYGVSNVANTVGIAGVAPATLPALAGGYAGAGRYVANSAGVVHVAKREAEPEAEAEAGLLYRGYGYGGLGYAGLGYARRGYAGLGYGYAAPATYGYSTHGYYGKRSAEAEPKADAGLYYGGYGAGLGYAGYGYSGLGYARYGLGYGRGYGY